MTPRRLLSGAAAVLVIAGAALSPTTASAAPISAATPTAPILPDIDAPTAPPRLHFPSGLTLDWEPSTDDQVVAGYEVYVNGRHLATTTDTRWPSPVPPPLPIPPPVPIPPPLPVPPPVVVPPPVIILPPVYVFGVRAFDRYGNLSPFSVISVGVPPDATPPTAPARLTARPQGRLVWFAWAPSTDNVTVAGYEVTLNGTVIDLVGGTTAVGVNDIRLRIQVVQVRAFDGAGTFSKPTVIRFSTVPIPS